MLMSAMLVKAILVATALVLAGLPSVKSSKVLILFPFQTRSENNLIWPLAEGLAKRGHELTLITVWKRGKKIPGIEEHTLETIQPSIDAFFGSLFQSSPGSSSSASVIEQTRALKDLVLFICEETSKNQAFQEYMAKTRQADLVIITPFFCDCVLPVVDIQKAPFIYFSSTAGTNPRVSDATGFLEPLSFCPSMLLPLTDRMNFWERLANVLLHTQGYLGTRYYMEPASQEKADAIFGPGVAKIRDVHYNVSLVFGGSPHGISTPKPSMPQVVSVGGLNIQDSKPLPRDLEDWVTGSKNGFIYFSLGSAVQGKLMPEKFRKMFIEAFSRLSEYRILWKWETEIMDDLPKHVKLSKWLPQQDLLGHANIKLFITHGGLLSTQEATYHGVPVVGIPIGADQMLNMKKTEMEGAGLTLEWSNLSADGIYNAVRRVLDEPSFRENLKRRSAIMKDQPETPLERAVFWTEYVIRHKGAPHLRSAARELTWYQYHLVDVWAFIILVLTLLVVGSLLAVRSCFRLCFGSKSKDGAKSKKGAKRD